MTRTQLSRPPEAEAAAQFARAAQPLLDSLLRRARQLARNEADAEDLLQDTLLHAFSGFHTFRQDTNFKAWLFRILYNRWVSTHRYRQRRPAEVPVDAVSEHDLAAGAARRAAGSRSVEAEVLAAVPDTEIKVAMDAIPRSFREAVFYADVQGYTLAETAAILDVPVGTVMSRVSRGRQRLRTALASSAVYEQRIA